MPTLVILTALAVCFAASAAGVAMFARWAAGRQLLDVPNERSSHDRPTPRGGGAVIVAVAGLSLGAAIVAGMVEPAPGSFVVAACAVIIAVVSAVDDVRSLPSSLRLLVHTICAASAVMAIAGVSLPVPMAVLAVLWIVGLTNAYNFMDGIDGIAGGQAIIAGAALALASLSAGLSGQALTASALAAGSAGFLLHNWSPARIFMGDVASAFLGFVFAVMVLRLARDSVPLALGAALSLWPFVFDTSLTISRRAWRRENLLASHRSHLYQRLVISGWSHARVAALYICAAAAGAAAGLGWALPRARGSVLILVIVPVMAGAIWMIVWWRESSARLHFADPQDRHRH